MLSIQCDILRWQKLCYKRKFWFLYAFIILVQILFVLGSSAVFYLRIFRKKLLTGCIVIWGEWQSNAWTFYVLVTNKQWFIRIITMQAEGVNNKDLDIEISLLLCNKASNLFNCQIIKFSFNLSTGQCVIHIFSAAQYLSSYCPKI